MTTHLLPTIDRAPEHGRSKDLLVVDQSAQISPSTSVAGATMAALFGQVT